MSDASCALHSRALRSRDPQERSPCLLQPRSSRSVAALHRKNAGQQYPDDQRHAYENGASRLADHDELNAGSSNRPVRLRLPRRFVIHQRAPPLRRRQSVPGPYGEEGGDHGYRQEVQGQAALR